MSGTAFVYGTLLADEVLKLLIRRVPPSKPATLSGFSRHRVKGQVFPAIIPATPQDKVQGKVSDVCKRCASSIIIHTHKQAARRHIRLKLNDGKVQILQFVSYYQIQTFPIMCLQVLLELTPSELHILDGRLQTLVWICIKIYTPRRPAQGPYHICIRLELNPCNSCNCMCTTECSG